jgi:hypothetical protein
MMDKKFFDMDVTHHTTVASYADAVKKYLPFVHADTRVQAVLLHDNEGVSSMHVLALPGVALNDVIAHVAQAFVQGVHPLYVYLPIDEFMFRAVPFALHIAMYVVGSGNLQYRLVVPNEGVHRSV